MFSRRQRLMVLGDLSSSFASAFVSNNVTSSMNHLFPQYLFAVFSLMNNTPFSLKMTHCFSPILPPPCHALLPLFPKHLIDKRRFFKLFAYRRQHALVVLVPQRLA
jgi:hypothetical protein